MKGPIDKSTPPLPAIAINVRAYVVKIKGAVSIIALPMPDCEISIGLLIKAKINKAKKIKIGTIRYLFEEVSTLDL
jgi:hypothetical protein